MEGVLQTSGLSKMKIFHKLQSYYMNMSLKQYQIHRNIFKSTNPRRIALSLKHSANASKRRKGTPYQSAMSMLNFYINRAGKNLSQKQKRVLERAKGELRDAFGRD